MTGDYMVSLISLDLGGKNTGFFSFTTKNVSNIDVFQSGTITYDESFVLSQVARRGKRHGKRNNLRNTLVKRLFLLLLQKHYGLNVDVLPDEILGLFNKRGYTYASFEIKDDEKENLESDILKEFLNDKLTKYTMRIDDEVEDFLNQIASDETTFNEYKKDFENLFGASTHQPKKQLELTEEIKKDLEKEDVKELLNGLKIVKKIIEEFHKQQNQGNLPRAKYFEEINIEISGQPIDKLQNPKIQEFFKTHNLQIHAMQNLIGNLSNYQLKELRRYFNDEAMAKEDFWSCEKLHRITWRFIQSWHPKSAEDKERQKENLANLKTKSIIEFLTTTNPLMTIPPYDDMNNRGAVKCQTLRLNEEYLDKHLPRWRAITHALASEAQKENLESSTVRGYSEDSTLLHRILDTSSASGPYKLRSGEIEGYIDRLTPKDAKNLQKFTKEYYQLVKEKVRTGIWTKDDDMFKKCDHNPPHKNNQIHNLVAGILGKPITKEQFEAFENELWNVKFGNKKLSSYCKNIEEFRKSHGNLFKSYIEELFREDKKEFTKEEEKEKKLLDKMILDEWVTKIGDFFNIEELYRARFNNHFSMAQLHTIIDTTRSGFNATCKWCSCENQYRASTKIEINEQTGEVTTNANCQRLPADTQRPFSGKIERYIDKLGYEIAKVKAKELEGIKEDTIDLKIILEQNAFAYEESIRNAKIKNANTKAKKALEEAKKRGLKNIEDKTQRIKDFSNGICPYCGQSVGEDGEIDHILPRSYTLKKYDTVFNSEGNLLYVHQKCNQAKAEKIYSLQNIKAPVTNTWIEKKIANLTTYKTFSVLTQEQQKAFKYALFLDNSNEAYQKVISWLRTDQSSRVNGTQKYLAKKIQEKLKAMFPHKTFNFEFILADANDVHDLREKYAVQNPLIKKPESQPPSSHTIDAIVSFLSVYSKITNKEELPDSQKVLQLVEINNIKTKPLGKIQKDQKENLGGTTIFKDSIYQERFAPIYAYENKFYTGFVGNGKTLDFSNCVQIKEKDFECVRAYIKHEIQKPNGLNIYELDKQKILTLFHNISKGSSSEIKLAELLNKFSYNLLKTSVEEAPKILKDDKKLSTKIYDKTIVLPIKNEWLAFHRAFKKHLEAKEIEYKEKDGKYNVGEDVLSEFCKSYFGIQNKPIRNKARKVFSLPSVETPSGGFRIRRKNHKGEDVYQLVGIDGASSKGYELNHTSKTKIVLLDNLLQSRNLSLKNPNYMVDKKYVPMNQNRIIVLNGYQIIFSFDTVDRNKVILSMPWEKLSSMLFEKNISIYDLPEKLPIKDALTEKQKNGIIKKEFEKEFTFKEHNSNKIFSFKPRDAIYIKKVIDNIVTIEFVNENRGILSYFYCAKLLDD
jgi:CRISPR system subtype II-B RNA-guided endonuclease Cas9/Csx12